jgi:hypothetical protein
MVTPHLPTGVLMSRRVVRLIEKHAKLSMSQREAVEDMMDKMLGIEPEELE